MPVKIEAAPNPKSADYKLKSSFIAQLGSSNGNDAQTDHILFNLGNSLGVSPLLSNKQRENFLFALVDSGLLTYHEDYCRALDKAEDRGKDEVVAVKASLDGVRWEIERDDWLQARTVVVAAQLSSEKPSERKHIQTIAELLNTAHLTARVATDEDIPGIKKFEELEKQVYLRRNTYAKELISLGLANRTDVEDIEELSLPEFSSLRSYGQTYDMFIAIHFAKSFKGQNTVERFKELQEVIYAGTAMGMRDQDISERRLFDEY